MGLHRGRKRTSTRRQTQKLLLLSLPSPVWASWATWIPIKPFAAYKRGGSCFLEHSILDFGLKTHYHARSPLKKKMGLSLPSPKQMWLWMLDYLQRKITQSTQSRLAVHILSIDSIGLKVTGGSLKKTATLKPDLVHKQKIKRQNQSRLPIRISEKLGSVLSSYGSRELRYRKICHLVSLTLLGS